MSPTNPYKAKAVIKPKQPQLDEEEALKREGAQQRQKPIPPTLRRIINDLNNTIPKAGAIPVLRQPTTQDDFINALDEFQAGLTKHVAKKKKEQREWKHRIETSEFGSGELIIATLGHVYITQCIVTERALGAIRRVIG